MFNKELKIGPNEILLYISYVHIYELIKGAEVELAYIY